MLDEPSSVYGLRTQKGRPLCTCSKPKNNCMRMQIRRFTRLTNAFSKKLENLKAALALHFAHYNFVQVHRTLRVTPAMAACICDRIWELPELVGS